MSTIWDKLGNALAKLLSKQDQGKTSNTLLNPQKTPLATNPLRPKTTISGIVSGGVGIEIPASEIAGSKGVRPNNNSVADNVGTGSSAVPISKPYAGKMPASQIVGSASGSVGNRSGSPKSILPSGTSSGNHDNASVSPNDRPGSRPDSSSAGTAIPKEHADLANLLEKAASDIDFNNWTDKTYKQQLSAAQKSGLTNDEQWALLNATPHYVETIAKVQDLFAYRAELGLTIGDAKILAKKLFAIADERNDAINRTGRYESDPNVVPKVLRLLDEQEDKLLGGLGKDTNETGQPTWYNGENDSDADDDSETTPAAKSDGYIQVPGQSGFGPKSNNPAVNCYGYILMNLGIEPSDGNYDIQPGQLSEKFFGDHAHTVNSDGPQNTEIEVVANYIVRDMEQAGKQVRVIDSYGEAADDETVIALKTAHPLIGVIDYHCAIQLQDGSWADKQGTTRDSRFGAIEDPDKPWGNWLKRYDSETVYIAISKP